MRKEKRIEDPVSSGSVISKSTPLAEIFWVTAAISPFPVETTTGSESGKRTAQRTSWRGFAGVEPTIESGIECFISFINCTLD
jgi:hypothetical protein